MSIIFNVLMPGILLTMVTVASTVRIVSHRTNSKEKRKKGVEEQTVTQELLHVHQRERDPWFCGPAVPLRSGESLEAGLADSTLGSCSKRGFPCNSFFSFQNVHIVCWDKIIAPCYDNISEA